MHAGMDVSLKTAVAIAVVKAKRARDAESNEWRLQAAACAAEAQRLKHANAGLVDLLHKQMAATATGGGKHGREGVSSGAVLSPASLNQDLLHLMLPSSQQICPPSPPSSPLLTEAGLQLTEWQGQALKSVQGALSSEANGPKTPGQSTLASRTASLQRLLQHMHALRAVADEVYGLGNLSAATDTGTAASKASKVSAAAVPGRELEGRVSIQRPGAWLSSSEPLGGRGPSHHSLPGANARMDVSMDGRMDGRMGSHMDGRMGSRMDSCMQVVLGFMAGPLAAMPASRLRQSYVEHTVTLLATILNGCGGAEQVARLAERLSETGFETTQEAGPSGSLAGHEARARKARRSRSICRPRSDRQPEDVDTLQHLRSGCVMSEAAFATVRRLLDLACSSPNSDPDRTDPLAADLHATDPQEAGSHAASSRQQADLSAAGLAGGRCQQMSSVQPEAGLPEAGLALLQGMIATSPLLGQLVLMAATQRLYQAAGLLVQTLTPCRAGGAGAVAEGEAGRDDQNERLGRAACEFEGCCTLFELLATCLQLIPAWCQVERESPAAAAAVEEEEEEETWLRECGPSLRPDSYAAKRACPNMHLPTQRRQDQQQQQDHDLQQQQQQQQQNPRAFSSDASYRGQVGSAGHPAGSPGAVAGQQAWQGAGRRPVPAGPLGQPVCGAERNGSYLRTTAKGLVATFALLPALRARLPLFCASFVRSMAAMAASMQHVAVAPEFSGCLSRRECMQLCVELKEAFTPASR